MDDKDDYIVGSGFGCLPLPYLTLPSPPSWKRYSDLLGWASSRNAVHHKNRTMTIISQSLDRPALNPERKGLISFRLNIVLR